MHFSPKIFGPSQIFGLATPLVCCSLQLLLVYHVTRWSVYKKIVQ